MGSAGLGVYQSRIFEAQRTLTDGLRRTKSFTDLLKVMVRAHHGVRLRLKDDEPWEQKAEI